MSLWRGASHHTLSFSCAGASISHTADCLSLFQTPRPLVWHRGSKNSLPKWAWDQNASRCGHTCMHQMGHQNWGHCISIQGVVLSHGHVVCRMWVGLECSCLDCTPQGWMSMPWCTIYLMPQFKAKEPVMQSWGQNRGRAMAGDEMVRRALDVGMQYDSGIL